MPAFIVSYDLRNPHRDYSRLYTRLEAWRALHVLESVYMIMNGEASSTSLRDDLQQYIDSDDGLLVAKLTGAAAWQKLNCSNQHMKENLNA